MGVLDVIYDGNFPSPPNTFPPFGENSLKFWSTEYSDLINVAFGAIDTTPEIFLSPSPGFQVTLNSFQLGAWPDMNRTTQVSLLTGSGLTLFHIDPFIVSGTTSANFSFSGLTSADGIRIQFGPDGNNVGIDNIDFTVAAVPIPAAGWLLGIGLVGVCAVSRRRKA
jgi:hypothetical protein